MGSPVLSIGVGIVITHDPLLGPGRALIRWDEKVDPRSRMALSYQ